MDVVYPTDRVTDKHTELIPGAGSRIVKRLQWLAFFKGEVRWELCEGQFMFYTCWKSSDASILDYIEKHGPRLVLPTSLDVFARHRWGGAQEVFEASTLYCSTLDLFNWCMPVWMGKKPPVDEISKSGIHALSGYSDTFAARQKKQVTVVVPVPAADPEERLPAVFTDTFLAGKRVDLGDFSISKPRGPLLISSLINNGMDVGLRGKLYGAGERWRRARDQRTAAGYERSYRVVEAAQNKTERQAAQRALELLCNSDEWRALPAADRTLRNRSLAFRMLTRQMGSMLILLKIPHENAPYLLFNVAVCGNQSEKDSFAKICQCLQDDFTHYWLQEYPAQHFSELESSTLLAIIADWIKTSSTRSECGHSFWQSVAHVRSLRVITDSFEPVSAALFMQQNKRCEQIDAITDAPRPLGRKPKPKIKKPRKRKKKS
jgi:hypothetical protein